MPDLHDFIWQHVELRQLILAEVEAYLAFYYSFWLIC